MTDNFDARQLPFITRSMFDFGEGATFQLIVQVISTTVDPIEIRGFTKQGAFTFSIVPAGDNSFETFTLGIPDVPVSVSIMADPNGDGGIAAYALMHLAINGNRTVLLAQGSLHGVYGIAWPQQLQPTDPQAKGFVEVVSFADPGVGTDFSDMVPANNIWEILAVQMILTASAAVANRTVRLDLSAGNGPYIQRADGTAITASQVCQLNFVPGGTTQVITSGTVHEIALPQPIFITAGKSLATTVANIDAGDQLSGIKFTIRRTFMLN